jgi:DNA end-binding protein Ku
MTRSVWTGTLSAGMLVIPVKLVPAVSEDKVELHQVRRSDGSRVEYRRFAKADGKEVAYSDIAKGCELPDGRVVVLSDSDIESAYGAKNRTAKILYFTDMQGSVPRTAHKSAYHVEPGAGGGKAYALLAQAMWRSGTAAVVLAALGNDGRESQALLYPPSGDGYLVLERLQLAADLTAPDFKITEQVTPDEIGQAQNLIAAMTKEFDWTAFADTSAEKLNAVIQAKVTTGQVSGAAPAAAPGAATATADLMSVLAASVEQAKAERAPKPPARKPRAPRVTKAKEAAA